jgi:hypothetical protein
MHQRKAHDVFCLWGCCQRFVRLTHNVAGQFRKPLTKSMSRLLNTIGSLSKSLGNALRQGDGSSLSYSNALSRTLTGVEPVVQAAPAEARSLAWRLAKPAEFTVGELRQGIHGAVQVVAFFFLGSVVGRGSLFAKAE